jgi:hypothetical protein
VVIVRAATKHNTFGWLSRVLAKWEFGLASNFLLGGTHEVQLKTESRIKKLTKEARPACPALAGPAGLLKQSAGRPTPLVPEPVEGQAIRAVRHRGLGRAQPKHRTCGDHPAKRDLKGAELDATRERESGHAKRGNAQIFILHALHGLSNPEEF